MVVVEESITNFAFEFIIENDRITVEMDTVVDEK